MRQTDVTRAEQSGALQARFEDLEDEIREISSEQRRRTSKVYQEQ